MKELPSWNLVWTKHCTNASEKSCSFSSPLEIYYLPIALLHLLHSMQDVDSSFGTNAITQLKLVGDACTGWLCK